MAIQNKPVTLVGAQTVVSAIHLYPQLDGSVVLVSVGTTKDTLNNVVALNEARLQATGVAALDNLVARGLTELRKSNGLEV